MVGRDEQTTDRLGQQTPTAKLDDAQSGDDSVWRIGPGQPLDGGRYLLRRRLGYGGMSTVWLATDRKLDRDVAIKVLADTLAADAEYVRRFDREARVAARLVHPNLVSVYDFDAGERPYLVMEYVEGGDLAEALKAGRVIDTGELALDLLSALDHIHSAGVIHRDVKPKNILLGADERVLLTDFGIARPSDATQLTRTGLVLGTSSYIAPEVLAGSPSSERSDLYSAGVTLAEVAEIAGASDALWTMIDRMRDAEPGERPESAISALRALEADAEPRAAATSATSAMPPPPPAAPAHAAAAGNRRRVPLVVIGVIAAVAGLALLLNAVAGDGLPEGDTGDQPVAESRGGEGGGGRDGASPGSDSTESTIDEAVPADGAALNDQGYALIQGGDYDQAVSVLQRAVDQLEGSEDLTYAYALYNLGWALRLAGRPEEAIPVLEARLEIPNQTGVVRRELDQAYRDAGAAPGGEEDPDDD